jgi:hypothetical protein
MLPMQVSPATCHFIPLWSKNSPQHPVLRFHIESMLRLCLKTIPLLSKLVRKNTLFYNQPNISGEAP